MSACISCHSWRSRTHPFSSVPLSLELKGSYSGSISAQQLDNNGDTSRYRVFWNMFFAAYLISPKTCHRFVGVLEEEAVYT